VSEPIRYALRLPDISYGTEESPNGKYIRYEDYARLKAEVEKLKALTAEMDSTINVSQAACRKYKAEVERLTAFTTRTITPNEKLEVDLENCRIALRVKYEEVAKFKAEVERLTNNCNYLDQKLDDELDKSAMLCGQVERLTKAGDVMAGVIGLPVNSVQSSALIENWKAAKEGKQ